MQNAVKSRFKSLQLGEVQTYKNIAIVPIIAASDGAFPYRTLAEALSSGDLVITEVSNSGSVPELLVANRGQQPTLLLDGEELAGAKQNRVLNTTILLKELSETRIPVSCTEQGRWSYISKAFLASGNVMAYKSRSLKTRSVQHSLEKLGAYQSNQHEVWAGIAELQAKAGAPSPTSAMSDVYNARDEDLRKSDVVFKPVANQVGLLAFIDGAPAGVDLLSRTAAYAKLHPKLVRSYALEALLDSTTSPLARQAQSSPSAETIAALARQFLDEVAAAEEREFPSVSYGTDYRYRSPSTLATHNAQHSAICGSALVHENEVIHAAFFRLENPQDATAPSSPMNASRPRFQFFRNRRP